MSSEPLPLTARLEAAFMTRFSALDAHVRTLMLLEDRMALLRERYRLSDQDLNLDLGPLGPLLPR